MSLRSDYPVLLIAMGALFSTMVARLALSPVIPQVVDDFLVSKGLIGLGLTGMWATYALLQFPSGLLGERFGERSVILLALLLTGIGSLVLSVAPSFPMLVVCLLFLGAGAGLYYSVGSTLITRTFDNTGFALGAHSVGLPIAGLLTPIVVSAISVKYGWRPAVLVGAAVALPLFLVALVRWKPDPTQSSGASIPTLLQDVQPASLLVRPTVLYTVWMSVLTAYSYQSFTSFFPTFLVEYRSMSIGEAGVSFAAVFVVTAVFLPILGTLSERYNREGVIAAAATSTAIGFSVLLTVDSFRALVVGIVLLGIGMAWGGALNSRFMDIFSDDERGIGFGLVRTVYLLIGSTGSIATGFLVDSFGWTTGYGTVVLLLASCAVGIVLATLLGVDV